MCKCELYVLHRIKVKVESLIIKITHKHIALRFWVRVWCQSLLCGCPSLDVGGLHRSSHDTTMVSELRFDEGYDRDSRSIAQKTATAVQAVSVYLRRNQQRRYKQVRAST